jgi:hypothetical protein
VGPHLAQCGQRGRTNGISLERRPAIQAQADSLAGNVTMAREGLKRLLGGLKTRGLDEMHLREDSGRCEGGELPT